jgi:N-acetylmuramoyl-L-alanine amidase
MKLLLDAGHGGGDPGAIAKAGSQEFHEADINLEVVLRMRNKIKDLYPIWEVELSRSSDIYMSPGGRCGLIKRTKPDAAVSIHCNSSSNIKATGHEVIYREEDDMILAQDINNLMSERLPIRDRGLKSDIEDLGRSLAILSTPGIPTVIVEMGFISNPNDLDVLLDFNLLSDTIVAGIARWAEA